jgi:hypothetical protein
MSTCVFYIDEAGSPDSHQVPLQSGTTPIFTLGALAFPLSEWRSLDREFLSLKRQFFPDELGRSSARDEETEIKGRELTSPHQATSSRRHAFLKEVLSFARRHQGTTFGVSFLKNPSDPAPARSLYTNALQILVERFSQFVAEHPVYSNGVLICDSRMKHFDITVARSHMSYVFGNEIGRQLTNLQEAPLFADSRLTVGLQVTDILVSVLYTNHYDYYLRNLDGAPDYGHMRKYWPIVDELQFKGRQLVDGFRRYGYRPVDLRGGRTP